MVLTLPRAYPDDGPLWGGVDAQAALARLLDERERRLHRLGRWLLRFGIDLAAGLAGPDLQPLAGALDRWCRRTWPRWARRELADPADWYAASWPRAEVACLYTLISDVGIALGERVIRCAAPLAWGIDAYAAHEADGVPSFGRIVVLDPRTPLEARSPRVYDALDQAFMRYQAEAFGQVPAPFAEAMCPLPG